MKTAEDMLRMVYERLRAQEIVVKSSDPEVARIMYRAEFTVHEHQELSKMVFAIEERENEPKKKGQIGQ